MVALAIGSWSVTLGQDSNWDLLNYHLYNPYAFLNDRLETDLAPAGLQSYFNPLLDVAYFAAISFFSPKTVAFLIGFFQGLNFLLLYNIANLLLEEHRLKRVFALFLALGGVLSVGFMAETGTAMHDSLVALFPLLSLWMLLSVIGRLKLASPKPVLSLLVISGLVAGTGIGLKLVSAIYVLPLCLSLLLVPSGFDRRLKISLIFSLAVLLGFFVTGGWWLTEMWRLFGNPLFPQFNDIFQGELAGLDVSRDLRFLPTTLFDRIFYPIIFTFDPHRVAELEYRQFSWICAYAAILGLLGIKTLQFFKKTGNRGHWSVEKCFLLAFFCGSYLLWLLIFGIYRYLIVIELLIPLLLFVVITHLFKSRYSHHLAILLIVLITMVNLRGIPDWGHTGWAEKVYRVEPGVIAMQPEPAVVYLAGQPLSWIIPALDIQSPFIQVVPNMTVTEAYWQRAKLIAGNRTGKSFMVFEQGYPDGLKRAKSALINIGLLLDEEACSSLVAYLGTSRREYRICEVRKTESE